MAKKTLIIDDLTGETGARTRTLRFDGIDYEIDLTDASFAELRALLKPYLRAARQVGRSTWSPARVAAVRRRRRQRKVAPARSRRPTSAADPRVGAVGRAWR